MRSFLLVSIVLTCQTIFADEPCKDCPSNVDKGDDEKKSGGAKTVKKEKEIIYIRYDDKNMKYLYLCAVCDHFWNNNK